MKVVHVAYEVAPIYKVGGLGDVAGSLPKSLAHLGIDVSVVMPGYGFVKRLKTLPRSDVPVYYVENALFTRPFKYSDPRAKAQAYAHFCLGALQELKRRNVRPDIIHCHDWHSALIPVLLKKRPDAFFEKTKTILTIHNIGYQGNFPCKYFNDGEFADILTCFPDWKRVSFLREGIRYTDFLTTVSPNHAREIRRGQANFGLKQVLAAKRGRFLGILNGIDTDVWNPRHDGLIAKKFNLTNVFSAKPENKQALQKKLGLEVSPDIPLFGFIARLTVQKGLEFLVPLLSQIPRERIQVVILGSGEKKYERMLENFKKTIDRRWYAVEVKFDEEFAHMIYAGSDFFLVPSIYEPCGLTQMIAMNYGSLPVVSPVGGLADTVKDGETGIVMKEVTAEALSRAVEQASDVWENNRLYMDMVSRVMRKDFSWNKSAREYASLYKKVLRP